jgi:hypothetical protein
VKLNDIVEREELTKDEQKLKNINKHNFEKEIDNTFRINLIEKTVNFIDEYQKKYGELDFETINVLYKFARGL